VGLVETMRRARVDDNHAEITAALRAVGASVQSLASVGKGCPDLLVGYRGKNYIFEVKDGSKPASRQHLNQKQQEWRSRWEGSVHIVRSVQGALGMIGAVK